MTRSRGGFTIVEVLIAVVLLGIGMLVLAGGAGGVTRMLSNGSRKTRAYAAATSIVDSLRNMSANHCSTMPASGSGTYPGGISHSWAVTNAGTTNSMHTVTVTVSYRVGPYLKGDTLIANLYC